MLVILANRLLMSPGSWRTVVHYMPVATMTVVPFRAPMPAVRLHHGEPGRGPAADHPAVPHVLHHPLVVSSHPFLELVAAVCGKHRHELLACVPVGYLE